MPRISITTGASAGNKRRAATHFGRRDIEDVVGSSYVPALGVSVLEYSFSFDDLPVAGVDALIPRIPAGARIRSASVSVVTAMAGTSGTLTIGLSQTDGTVIDADGIDAAIPQAALTAGSRIVSDGALVEFFTVDAASVSTTEPPLYTSVGIGAADGQVVVTTGGTVTAGKFILRVEFEPENLRA